MDPVENEINAVEETDEEEEEDDLDEINYGTNPTEEQNDRLAFQNYARMIRLNDLNRNQNAPETVITTMRTSSEILGRGFQQNSNSIAISRPQSNDSNFVTTAEDNQNNDAVVVVNQNNNAVVAEDNQNNDAVVFVNQSNNAVVAQDNQNNESLVFLNQNNNAVVAENNQNNEALVFLNQNNNAVVVENNQNNDVIVIVEDNQSNDDVVIIEDNQSNDATDNEVEILNEIRPSNEGIDQPLTQLSDRKKRKRTISQTSIKSSNDCKDECDDDGSICPICYDAWEMSGSHRLTSLKCGHLFGHSCIKRWLQQCASNNKCCPTCKTRAQIRDLRFIYSKRILAVDKTEEYRLAELLNIERAKYTNLSTENGLLKLELATLKNLLSKAQFELQTERLRNFTGHGGQVSSVYEGNRKGFAINYKLFLEKNIEICKEPGCRVMIYGQRYKNLFVSQKSNQNLFPGYGVKYIDVTSFRSTHFLHMSIKCIRDLSLSSCEDLMVSATQERSAKLYNIHDRTIINVFTPSNYPIWSCSFDQGLHQYLYLGNSSGSTFTYDIRQPSNFIREFRVDSDFSPVINICAVSSSKDFPYGGVLVCKLQSIWFNEYNADQTFNSTKLNVEGPFFSMSYDVKYNNVLISTRPKLSGYSKHILARLVKIDNVTVLQTIVNLNGSKHLSVMSRCSQIAMNDTTLIAAYLEDVKLLGVWDSRKAARIQSLPITDLVYDTCSIVNDDETYLAALTESKCRIYKVITDRSY